MADETNGEDSPAAVTAIGISFGNSNSSIAYTTSEGKSEVIANEEGDRNIPSILSYVDGEEYHGTQAKAQLVRNAGNTIAYFKEYIGREFSEIDPSPCQGSSHPQQHGDTVSFSVQDKGDADDAHTLPVNEVVRRHIVRLATSASDYLGKQVTAAVVSVPTNWSDRQKAALVAAAKAAGVQVLQMIHDPTAALLAYDARSEAEGKDKIVVVADLGGTRSDVAVIASRSGMYSVLATKHGYDMGGAQLDELLVDHFAKEFLKKHKSAAKDPRQNPRSLAKLKLEAEATKKALSLGGSATLSVESLSDGLDFSASINRTRYELLAGKVFGRLVNLVREAVEAAQLDVLDIDEVILAGGTAHTPRLASNLQSVFPSSLVLAPSTSATAIDPSSLTARGAAIQASLIQDFEPEDIEQSTHPMVTVTPHLSHTIGVMAVSDDIERGVFVPLVAKDSAVPCKRSAIVNVPKSGAALVKICQAERQIKVTIKEKPKTNGDAKKVDSDDEDDSEEEEEEEQDEEIREKVWKVLPGFIAEAGLKDIQQPSASGSKKESARVEVTVNIAADMSLTLAAKEVGGKAAARGTVAGNGGATTGQNGSAS